MTVNLEWDAKEVSDKLLVFTEIWSIIITVSCSEIVSVVKVVLVVSWPARFRHANIFSHRHSKREIIILLWEGGEFHGYKIS